DGRIVREKLVCGRPAGPTHVHELAFDASPGRARSRAYRYAGDRAPVHEARRTARQAALSSQAQRTTIRPVSAARRGGNEVLCAGEFTFGSHVAPRQW